MSELWASMGQHMSAGPFLRPNQLIVDISQSQRTNQQTHTAIADISEFQNDNMPANTDIADLADISDLCANMGRHMSTGTAPGAEPPYFGHLFNTNHR